MYLPLVDCTYYKTYKAILTQIPDGFIFKNPSYKISYSFEQITVRPVKAFSEWQPNEIIVVKFDAYFEE